MTNTHQVDSRIYTLIPQFLKSTSEIFIPVLTFFTLIIIYVVFLRKRPIPAFCYLWFFIALIPVSSVLPQGTIFAERFLYIPSLSFCLILALIFQKLYLDKFKLFTILLIILLTAVYIAQTRERNLDWQSSVTLWQAAVSVNPKIAINRPALAMAYYYKGDIKSAIKEFNIAINQNPLDITTLTNLGVIYYKEGKLELAKEIFKKAVSSESKTSEDDFNIARSRYNLAQIFEKEGEETLSLEEYKKALSIYQNLISKNPKYTYLYINLGVIYESLGSYELALDQFKKVLEITPNDALSYYNIAIILEKNNLEEAQNYYQKALFLNNKLIEARLNLGIIYGKKGQFEKAAEEFKKALEQDGKNALAHFNLALLYEKIGEKNLAIEEYQKGLKIEANKEAGRNLERLLN